MAIMVPDLHPQGYLMMGREGFIKRVHSCLILSRFAIPTNITIMKQACRYCARLILSLPILPWDLWWSRSSRVWSSTRTVPGKNLNRATGSPCEKTLLSRRNGLRLPYCIVMSRSPDRSISRLNAGTPCASQKLSRLEGFLPGDLKEHSVWLFDETEDPGLWRAGFTAYSNRSRARTQRLIGCWSKKSSILPFKVFSRLEEQIEQFCRAGERILSEEQERILEETELDRRKIFLGAAGTGKTFLAIEKARRLETAGKKVLFTCFNKNLAAYLRTQLPEAVYVQNIHDYFLKIAGPVYGEIEIPAEPAERSEFFSQTLPPDGL